MTETITRYRAKSKHGVLETVDFSTVAGKHFAFFELRDETRVDELKTLLTRQPFSQSLVARTDVSGKPVLIMQSDMEPSAIVGMLAERGEGLEKLSQGKGIDPWKIRSVFGFGGQSLQLTSTFLRAGVAAKAGKGFWSNVDPSIFVFAATNLAANVINLVYHQGEQVDDVHQLRYLKQRMNRELAPHLKEGESAPAVDDQRQMLRPHETSHSSIDQAKVFLKRHSVEVGELGLRYLGAVGLAYPATGWKSAFSNGRMPAKNSSGFRVYAGLSSIFGKTVALTSAIPDPYNPKPPTWLDTVREKFSFLGGGLIEITSFSALAYDHFFHTKGKPSGLVINGKSHRDWLGGIGASMFVMGYIVRSWAKFGERNVNMEELYAHASDTLANTPPEKIPQLVANTAANLAEHFQDKPTLNFATIYTNLANDLVKFHAQNKGAGVLVNNVVNQRDVEHPSAVFASAETPSRHVATHGAQVAPLAPANALGIH